MRFRRQGLAGALGLLSGLPFPYWAQVAVVAPLSSPGHGARVERAVHRLVGTVLGVVVGLVLVLGRYAREQRAV